MAPKKQQQQQHEDDEDSAPSFSKKDLEKRAKKAAAKDDDEDGGEPVKKSSKKKDREEDDDLTPATTKRKKGAAAAAAEAEEEEEPKSKSQKPNKKEAKKEKYEEDNEGESKKTKTAKKAESKQKSSGDEEETDKKKKPASKSESKRKLVDEDEEKPSKKKIVAEDDDDVANGEPVKVVPLSASEVNWEDVEFDQGWSKSKRISGFFMRYMQYKGKPLHVRVEGYNVFNCEVSDKYKASLNIRSAPPEVLEMLGKGDEFFMRNLKELGNNKKPYHRMLPRGNPKNPEQAAAEKEGEELAEDVERYPPTLKFQVPCNEEKTHVTINCINSKGKKIEFESITAGKGISTVIEFPYFWRNSTQCGVTMRCTIIQTLPKQARNKFEYDMTRQAPKKGETTKAPMERRRLADMKKKGDEEDESKGNKRKKEGKDSKEGKEAKGGEGKDADASVAASDTPSQASESASSSSSSVSSASSSASAPMDIGLSSSSA